MTSAAHWILEADHTTSRNTDTRRLVRKADASEVLVTDWREVGDAEHLVTVRWPADHSFYRPTRDAYSPLLFTESLRQGLALLSHTAFGLPLDHRLGWERFRSPVSPAALRATGEPAVIDMYITHKEITRRRMGTTYLTAHVEATRDGRHVGRAEVRYVTHPGAIYDRLRGAYANAAEAFARALPPAPSITPQLVGRTNPHDVTLAATDRPGLWQLRVDTSNTVLFDHPHDHVPGMVLLEAFSQAAQAEAAPRRVCPVNFDATFHRYVELDQPCWITAERVTRYDVRLGAVQNGAAVASAIVTSAPYPGH
ncbi:ScbA/BarX family gamma-butyrolactone biosynthesis protein [Streptomyces sp. NPDC091371]|uniref:ScbA/BarX family gamma-butyrolactone biosynthesis protein n=1 Tax=Streptomyces sp. NPDC091371 TaxID=3155303 RepID=UPI003449E7EA